MGQMDIFVHAFIYKFTPLSNVGRQKKDYYLCIFLEFPSRFHIWRAYYEFILHLIKVTAFGNLIGGFIGAGKSERQTRSR